MTAGRAARISYPGGAVAAMILALVGAGSTIVESPTTQSILFGLMFIAFPGVGLVLRVRVPGNPIGAMLVAVGALAGIGGIASAVTLLAPVDSVVAGMARWSQTWLIYPIIGLVLALLLLFPTGRLVTARWRWSLWTAALFVAMASVGASFYPAPSEEGGPNPLAVEGLAPLWLFLQDISAVPLLLAALAGLASIVVRYRRGDEVERHQLKWFLAASALLPIAIDVGNEYPETEGILVPIAFTLFPAAIGRAITRYHLYDIDRIVSRTVTYAALTAVLVAAYVAVVFSLRLVVPAQDDLAVVASTLIVAASFNPLRGRLQGSVDRRFNRSRVDRERVVADFARRLRSEAGLSDLSHDLVASAGTTMEPAWTSLWLKGPTA